MEISERLGDVQAQAVYLIDLGWVLYEGGQVDAAKEAGSGALNLSLAEGDQYVVCGSHRLLGKIYGSMGEREKAVYHLEAALGIASPSNWCDDLFWAHHDLAMLFSGEGKFDDAQAHLERAKTHVADDAFNLGAAMELQASLWYQRHRFEEAKSEALRAVDVYERLGASTRLERCRNLLRRIEEKVDNPVTSYYDGEALETALLSTTID